MDDKTRNIILVIALVIIAGIIVFLNNPFLEQAPVLPQTSEQNQLQETNEQSPYPTAPEIIGIHDWINSEPLTLAQLRGKVVLVDFWTYSCINCIRTFPYLRQWNETYAGSDFIIIGVHSPEFNFEKELANVQQAVNDNQITWPVALDNDMSTWKNYKNRFWPAKYLIDADGKIRYTHFGEGAYQETEEQIIALLEEKMGQDLGLETTTVDPEAGKAGFFRTPELYAGYGFGNYLGNTQTYLPEQITEFVDKENHEDAKIYLQGPWFNSFESVRHASVTENLEDYIAIKFLADEVNVVLGAGSTPYKVFVTLDGKKLEERFAGNDIQFDDEGNAFFEVDKDRLYNVISGPLGIYELKLASDSDEFELYTFTFGG